MRSANNSNNHFTLRAKGWRRRNTRCTSPNPTSVFPLTQGSMGRCHLECFAVPRLPRSVLVPPSLHTPCCASAGLRDDASIWPRNGLRLRGTSTCRVDAARPAPSDAHGFRPGRLAVAMDVPRP